MIKRKEESGITLIALIITIIVLLILAGVSISMVVLKNGIIEKAIDSKDKTNRAYANERVYAEVDGSYDQSGEINLDYLNKNLRENLDSVKLKKEDGTYEDLTEENRIEMLPVTVQYNGYDFDIGEPHVQVGDYVNYNPINEDKDGTKKVATEKLTYTSLKERGNGYRNQTFTVNENVKWRVLSINKNGKLDLIPAAESLDKVGKLTFMGATSYYYAEQELNKICAIYGYGYGAIKNSEWKYEIGGDPCESEILKLTGTGARSFSCRELEELTGVSASELFNLEKGEIYNYKDGLSFGNFKDENHSMRYYSIKKSDGFQKFDELVDPNWKDLFGDYGRSVCWMSARCVWPRDEVVEFGVRWIGLSIPSSDSDYPVESRVNSQEGWGKTRYILPVVRISKEAVDIEDENGVWQLK